MKDLKYFDYEERIEHSINQQKAIGSVTRNGRTYSLVPLVALLTVVRSDPRNFVTTKRAVSRRKSKAAIRNNA